MNRDGKLRTSSTAWLRGLESKDVVLAGMLADAPTECMIVIRTGDKGTHMDATSLDLTLIGFANRIHQMFVERRF